jgi:hypothetical protein
MGWLAEAPCSPPRRDGPLRELGREANRLPGQEGQKLAYSSEETHQIETRIGGRGGGGRQRSRPDLPGTSLCASAGRTIRAPVGSEVIGSNPSLNCSTPHTPVAEPFVKQIILSCRSSRLADHLFALRTAWPLNQRACLDRPVGGPVDEEWATPATSEFGPCHDSQGNTTNRRAIQVVRSERRVLLEREG